MPAASARQHDQWLLLALAVVLVVARVTGWSVTKVGQPRVHGGILAGTLLGPSLFGASGLRRSTACSPPTSSQTDEPSRSSARCCPCS